MRKLLVTLAMVVLFTIMLMVPAMARPPTAVMPETAAIDQMISGLTASGSTIVPITMATALNVTEPTAMATNYHGGLECLSGAQMNQAGFTQDIWETGQELTITANEWNCPGCSALVVPNNFTAMEQRHDVANYRHVSWMPASATRMENAMNVNRVTAVILRL